MLYSFDFTGLWVYALLDKENHKQVAIILKDPDLKDELKLERQVNCADKIIAWTRNNVKCKGFIGCIYLGDIHKDFQTVQTNWLADNF